MFESIFDSLVTRPIHAENGGLCISRGQGIHPDRVIDSFELIYVREGVLSIAEEDRPFDVSAGQSLILWPERRHCGTVGYDRKLSYYWLHFRVVDPHLLEECLSVIPQHSTVRRPDHLTDLFRRFLEDQETRELTSLSADLIILLMLNELSSSHPHEREESHKPAGRVLASRAEAFIATHFEQSISTSVVADHTGCNADYLSRVFQQTFGTTITEAILRRRMKKARALLRDTDIYLEQVAQQCGIEDVTYFRRIFKRETGMTPIAFRKMYARLHVNTE